MVFLPNGQWAPSTQPQALMTNPGTALPNVNPYAFHPAVSMGQAPQNNMQGTMQRLGRMQQPAVIPAPPQYSQVQPPQQVSQQPSQLPAFPQPMPGPQGPYQPMIGQFPMPQQAQPSLEQSVNNANPQSVQNFLTALHQGNIQGSGQNIMNQRQQQMPMMLRTQWQGYGGPGQNQLGAAANQAQMGGPVSTRPNAQNGIGGNQMQPNYQRQAVSDVAAKRNILPAEEELADFLSHLNAHSYEYKDPSYGEGRRISPMAQEMEESDLGKEFVFTMSNGYKAVDYGKMAGTNLAATALLWHKYNALESQLKEAMMNNLTRKKK